MSQQDRGAYTPQTDAPLAFDARAPRGGRRPLPMALIGSAVVLLVLLGAVVMYYRGGVKTADGAPPAVGQPVGAVKTSPPTAQAEDPFSNLDVYASQNVPDQAPAAPSFAPPPEQPKARPAPATGLTVQTVDPSRVHPAPAAAPAARPTTAVAVGQAPPAAQPAPALRAAVAPTPAAPAPAAPARTATAPAAAQPAPPVKTAAAAPAAQPAAGGPAAVQIGAYSSTALADKGYSEIASAFPGPMSGKSKKVEPLARDGKTLYRGLIGGFASRDAAQAFCNTLKAAGRTCLVRG